MKRFEYYATSVQSLASDLDVRLDELGEEGWELVCVVYDTAADSHTAFLKREKAG